GGGMGAATALPQFFAIPRLLDANLHDYGVEFFTIGGDAAVHRIVTVPTYLGVERVKIGQLDWRDPSGTAVHQQPSPKLPKPFRRLARLLGQRVVGAKSPPHHELPVGDVV